MAPPERADADTFLRELRNAPQGFVLPDEDQVLVLHVLDGLDMKAFRAPDPMDMVHEDFLAFLVEVYRCLSEPGIRERVGYFGSEGT